MLKYFSGELNHIDLHSEIFMTSNPGYQNCSIVIFRVFHDRRNPKSLVPVALGEKKTYQGKA